MARRKAASPNPVIQQDDLSRYFTLRQQRLEIDKQSRELLKKEHALEDQLVAMFKKKFSIEPGTLTCRVEAGGRYPKWKEEFEKRLGTEAVEEVIASTPYREAFIVELADVEEATGAA